MDQVKRSYGSEHDEEERQERQRSLLRRTNERFDRDSMSFAAMQPSEDEDQEIEQARAGAQPQQEPARGD